MNRWLILVIGLIIGAALVFGAQALIKHLKPHIPVVVIPPVDSNGTVSTGDVPTEVDRLKVDISKLKRERDALKNELFTIQLQMGSTEAAYTEMSQELDNLRAQGIVDSAQINELNRRMIDNRNRMKELNDKLAKTIAKLDSIGAPGSIVYTYKKFGTTLRFGLSGSAGYGASSLYSGYIENGKRFYADAGLYGKFLYADFGKAGVYTMGVEQSIFRPKTKIFIGRHINDIIPFFRNLEVRGAYVRDWNGYNEGQLGIGVDF